MLSATKAVTLGSQELRVKPAKRSYERLLYQAAPNLRVNVKNVEPSKRNISKLRQDLAVAVSSRLPDVIF